MDFYKYERIIMLWLIICYLATLTEECDGIIEARQLVTFAKQFKAPKPLTLLYNVPIETKNKLIKSMSKEGFVLDWVDEFKYTEKFLLIIIEKDEHLG